MKRTLIYFAFKENISQRVLEKVDLNLPKYFLTGKDSIEKFIEELMGINPPFILGLGEYSGRDKDKIRIETVCNNKFRNNLVGDKLITTKINYFLNPSDIFKLSEGIGISYCNLVSYLIMDLVNQGKLSSKYTFLHIPKTFNEDTAAKEIWSCIGDSI